MNKKDLRKELITKRKNLDSDYRRNADRLIFEKIIALDAYQKAQTIFCFVSTPDEINTFPLLEHAFSSKKRVTVPKCIEKGVMQAYHIQSFQDLKTGKYSLSEPMSHCPVVAPEELDLIIVPCLSCNPDGYRIGYGGGFYDRYLASTAAASVVICYQQMMLDEIPLEPFDQKADCVITDMIFCTKDKI